MNPHKELMSVLYDIAVPTAKPPRFKKQLDLEQAIVSFAPDFTEAQELLDALIGALKSRYRSDQLMVVEEEAKALRTALDEAQPVEMSAEDEAYADHRAGRE